MKALVLELQALGREVWAVSSTSEWVIRTGMKHFGIPSDRVLAAAVAVEDGKVTDKVIRVPSGKGKPQAIREVIGRTPDAGLREFHLGRGHAGNRAQSLRG